jgi:hypothetical protein
MKLKENKFLTCLLSYYLYSILYSKPQCLLPLTYLDYKTSFLFNASASCDQTQHTGPIHFFLTDLLNAVSVMPAKFTQIKILA